MALQWLRRCPQQPGLTAELADRCSLTGGAPQSASPLLEEHSQLSVYSQLHFNQVTWMQGHRGHRLSRPQRPLRGYPGAVGALPGSCLHDLPPARLVWVTGPALWTTCTRPLCLSGCMLAQLHMHRQL